MTIQLTRRALIAAMPAMASASVLAGCGGGDSTAAVDAEDTSLKFDATSYTTVNVTLDGTALKVRQYKVVYVAKPIKMASTQTTFATTTLADPYAYQTMIISVAESLVSDQTKPIYMVVNNSGWFTSAVATSVIEGAALLSTTDTDPIGAALKAGYVVVDVGSRSRGARAADGRWAGKAPAPVVDVKAAIRYLRLNDSLLPGTTNRIILTGTSGGGGLTSAVAASGNSTDYLPFLAEIGAAGVSGSGSSATSSIKDDVFAAVAYCPINNLGNADAGYEWEYNTTRTDSNTPTLNSVAYSAGPQYAASAAIAATFPAYLNGLALIRDDGTALTDANLRATTTAFVKKELEAQITKGTAVPALGGYFTVTQQGTTSQVLNDWLTLTGSGSSAVVANIDYAKYLNFITTPIKLKSVVAFDAVGVTGNPNISGESTLFGSDYYTYSNFSAWSWANNATTGDGSGVDDTGLSFSDYLASTSTNILATQIKLINPIAYLNTTSSDTAPYWYVRHGMIDRDTSFAMQVLLYHAIKKDTTVKDVDFKLPYLVPHSGNYDVQEAFTWIKAKLVAAG